MRRAIIVRTQLQAAMLRRYISEDTDIISIGQAVGGVQYGRILVFVAWPNTEEMAALDALRTCLAPKGIMEWFT